MGRGMRAQAHSRCVLAVKRGRRMHVKASHGRVLIPVTPATRTHLRTPHDGPLTPPSPTLYSTPRVHSPPAPLFLPLTLLDVQLHEVRHGALRHPRGSQHVLRAHTAIAHLVGHLHGRGTWRGVWTLEIGLKENVHTHTHTHEHCLMRFVFLVLFRFYTHTLSLSHTHSHARTAPRTYARPCRKDPFRMCFFYPPAGSGGRRCPAWTPAPGA